MTSLFSHSLLNDTDRDVRGAYRAFSRGKVHGALPGEGGNDRSSANVSHGKIMPWSPKKWPRQKVLPLHFEISASICP